jgi:ligand-binding sensor domain-containing protein
MLRCVLFLGLLFVSKTTISQTNPVWEIFNMSNSQIPDNTIRCLQTDSLGNLWVGTDNGLAYYNNGSWQVFTETNSGLADNYVRAVTVDTNNALWVGTTLGGVQKFDGTTWTTYNTTNSGIADNFIRTITIDKNNHKWIGTVEGLVYFDDVNWTTWQMSNSPILTNNIASIAVGPNNEKYIGTINGGAIYMNSDTTFEGIYTILNSGIPDNSQLKVKVDILGKPWFAGSAGGLGIKPGWRLTTIPPGFQRTASPQWSWTIRLTFTWEHSSADSSSVILTKPGRIIPCRTPNSLRITFCRWQKTKKGIFG